MARIPGQTPRPKVVVDPEMKDISSRDVTPTEEQLEMLNWVVQDRDEQDLEKMDANKHPVKVYREYVKGRQKLVFTDEQKVMLEGILGNPLCDNICHQIVDQAAGRLKFLRWEGSDKVDVEELVKKFEQQKALEDQSRQQRQQNQQQLLNADAVNRVATDPTLSPEGGLPIPIQVPPEPATDPLVLEQEKEQVRLQAEDEAQSTTHQFLSDLYIRQHVKGKSSKMCYDMCRDGVVYVAVGVEGSVEGGDFAVRLYREKAWDGETGMYVKYDEDDEEKVVYAVKEWKVRLRGKERKYIKRRTMWVEGELYRWVSEDGTGSEESWKPYMLASDKSWPVRNVDISTGALLPVPVVPLPNTGRDSDLSGHSELSGGVTGNQDFINNLLLFEGVGCRMTAFQMYTIAGINKGKKRMPDGSTVEVEPDIKVGPAEVWTSTDPSTSFGTLPPGDMSQILAVYGHRIARTAQMTSTPQHSITGGDWPSGEALLRAEQPAVAKAERQIETLEERWAQIGYLAVRLFNAHGPGGLDEDVIVSAIFDDPGRRDMLTKVAVADKVAPYVSNKEVLRFMDYSEDRIQAIMDEREEESQSAVDQAMQTFNAGPTPPQEQGGSPTPPAGPGGS